MKGKKRDNIMRSYFVHFHMRNMLAVIIFTIGGLFIGRTLWELVRYELHPLILIAIGFLFIFIGGVILHNFDS